MILLPFLKLRGVHSKLLVPNHKPANRSGPLQRSKAKSACAASLSVTGKELQWDVAISDRQIEEWLHEDAPFGDITSDAFVPETATASGRIIAKAEGVVAGVEVAARIFNHLGVTAKIHKVSGDYVKKQDVVLTTEGNGRRTLLGERVALNILNHLSGVATLTANAVARASRASEGTATVAATRKTTPGFRLLEKLAVKAGGGTYHRFSLSDAVLLKENHLALIGGVEKALAMKDKADFTKKVEIEVTTIEQAMLAAALGADIIMLDNFKPAEISQTVEKLVTIGLRHSVIIEASGGITVDNISEYAAAGADIISMGELTHSAPVLDMSMLIKLEK